MVSISNQYKPPVQYVLSDPPITSGQILEARRLAFLTKPNVNVIHPDYPAHAGPLLSFPPYDNDGTHNGADYDLVIHACYLLIQNSWPRQDGHPTGTPFLSYTKEPSGDPITSAVIVRDCYLHVPGRQNYPITPSFDHWRFPHATPNPNTDEQISSDLPRAWREVSIPRYHPRGDFKPDRPTIMQRDGTCRATDHITGLEVAHLVPNKASAWFRRNKMQSYALRPNDKEPWNDIQNKILLRADIHIMLDRKEIVPMPKKIDGQYRFVIKVIKGNEFHSYDTYELYHNRIFLEFRGIQPEYLFSRFAWNIFDVDILQVLSTARLRRAVHIFDPTDNIYKIEERYVSEFKVSRSQSANGNESSKRRRASAGPAECDSSDETLTSVSSESDSEEREEYEKRLCSLDVAQEQRGRKRTRSGDRFSDASTDVGSNVSMRHTAKTRMV